MKHTQFQHSLSQLFGLSACQPGSRLRCKVLDVDKIGMNALQICVRLHDFWHSESYEELKRVLSSIFVNIQQ